MKEVHEVQLQPRPNGYTCTFIQSISTPTPYIVNIRNVSNAAGPGPVASTHIGLRSVLSSSLYILDSYCFGCHGGGRVILRCEEDSGRVRGVTSSGRSGDPVTYVSGMGHVK